MMASNHFPRENAWLWVKIGKSVDFHEKGVFLGAFQVSF